MRAEKNKKLSMLRAASTAAAFGLAALAVPGCFLATDVDRFRETPPNTSKFFDLSFTITGADSHVDETFELRVVDRQKNIIAMLRASPLGGRDATFNLPSSLPKTGGLRLVFWADHNNSGAFDQAPLPFDHSWFVDVDPFVPKDPASNLVKIEFEHNTAFVPVEGKEIGGPAEVSFSGMRGQLGRRAQVSISDANSKQLVGVLRATKITQDAFTLRLPGIVDPGAGTRYSVLVTLDDGTPAAGGLEGYRFERASELAGLKLTFDPTKDQATKTTEALPRP
ncbi:MAG: hypothetical protein IPF92_21335 [Myxococcales bacterium]|jgi:hypothetical protein|nr:hypothetical protein [Myxococcales bacterium]MBL0197539.1 hypothetical protein [Myxococcales bacterium]HQY62025.1 hypothetical protein [Polyangiaceae bacterium]